MNDRSDQNETTVMTTTKPRTTTMMETNGEWNVVENVDFTPDILPHLRLLNISAVSRNFNFIPTTRAVETIFDTYLVSTTERQPYWIQSVHAGKNRKKQITIFIDNVYFRDFFHRFFYIKVSSKPYAKPMAIERFLNFPVW